MQGWMQRSEAGSFTDRNSGRDANRNTVTDPNGNAVTDADGTDANALSRKRAFLKKCGSGKPERVVSYSGFFSVSPCELVPLW